MKGPLTPITRSAQDPGSRSFFFSLMLRKPEAFA